MNAAPPPGPGWQKLHPLTPLVTGGRAVVVFAVVGGEESTRGDTGGGEALFIGLAVLTVLTLAMSVIKWLVTKWALDGPTLRIETGLLRRDARQLPLARIQAVDVARPLLARMLGLAELRIRLAGSGRSGGRLAYLSEPVALDLRARLLAGHHGLDQATPEPVERPMAMVAIGQLVASAVLSSATLIALALLVAIVVLTTVSPTAAAASLGTLAVYLFGFARITWRRVADQYGFSVALAPDGIRVRRGLLSTISETVPFARVQAVRKTEPLMWRLMGWCSLEVDVAGSPGQEQGTRSGKVTKSLLPVGSRAVTDGLLSSLLGLRQFELVKPPERARWKALLSYHFLAAGCDGSVAASTTGRLNKVTTWVPLEKVQSVRWVQGPLQRKFKLATVHVDAAGKRTRAEFRDRDVDEAKKLFEELVIDSRSARRRVSGRLAATVMSPAVMPPASAMGVGDVRAGVPGTTVPVVAVPGAGVPGAGGRAVQTDVGQPLPPPAQGSPPADEHLNGFRQD